MKRLVPLIVLVGIGTACYLALPPGPIAVPAGDRDRAVRGAIHVHTDRSDGTGTVEEVAAAAARAGLQFVILTDHGDGTRDPLVPQYYDGVLVIDAVEISSNGGHVVALDLPVSPYPLGGEARDVIEDIVRAGGFAIAAHPESSKDDLRWVDWDAPVGGVEWLNGDSEWRDERWSAIARALLTYPIRATSTLATLLDRPDALLRRWDALTSRRRVVAVASVDAHARLGLRDTDDPYQDSASVRMPSYEQMFRAFTVALTGVALRAEATADARAILDAIRSGHLYSVVDALAGPGALSFTAASGSSNAIMGDLLPAADAQLRVAVEAPAGARIQLLRDGEALASAQGNALEYRATTAGVYRVEVLLPWAPGDPPVPWMLSNPIYVGGLPGQTPGRGVRRSTAFAPVYNNGPATDWAIEANPTSRGALNVVPAVGGTQLLLRYAVGGAASDNPYVALVAPAGAALPEHERIVFNARASQPMRLSVQLRAADGTRWRRSVYLDPSAQEIAVDFADMTPVGRASGAPALGEVRSVLWVVDTVNTALGGSGEVWLDAIRYAR